MAKAVTEIAIGAAAIGAAFLIPGGGIAIGSMVMSHAAAVGALASIAGSEVMAGVADALKGNQGGLAVGVSTPIGPWGYIYGTQKVGGVEIFRESNNNTGSSSTSSDKQLHRVYCLAAHPCALGSWQLRIDGKQVLLTPSGSGWQSYSPTQTTLNISSISRTNGVVTMVLSGSMPAGTDGSTLQIRSVADNTFNGTWTVTQPNPSDFKTWTYVCGGSNTVSSGGNARTTYSDYKGKIHVEILNGNHTSSFPTLLTSGTSWKSSDLCLGRTLVYVQMGYDETVFPSSIPNVSFVIDGKNDIYDPRTGLKGFSKNPALCIADFLSMPVTKGGFGLSIGTDIPTAALIAAANTCDVTMALNTGGTTPQYTCSTFFQLNTARGTILKNLLSSCAGRISYQGGQFYIQPGQWVAPTLSLTDSDLIGAIDWNPRFSIRDTCNGVKGTYISPENAYQQADVPAFMCDVAHGYVSDAYLTEDGGERIFREANFPCTDSSAIAQRLAKIALMRTRFQGRGTIRCTLKAYQAVALDTIQITHPHYGWANKVFEATSSKFGFDKSGDTPRPYVELDIAETDPSIFNWTPTEQLTPQGYQQPNNVGARVCAPPEQVIAYSGTGGLVNGVTCPSTITTRTDGTVTNSIYVEWATPNDANVVHGGHIEIQWQAVGASTWTSAGKVDPSINYVSITGVSDSTSYNVQVRAVNAAAVPSDWVQASPYPVAVGVSQTTISPIKIIFPRPIGNPPVRVLPIGSYGVTLDDIMPLEQGAEQTTGKAIDVLVDGTTYGRTLLSGLTSGGVNFAAPAHTGLLPVGNHALSIQPIAGLMPAEAGANVTANHTAADTSKVNGVAASSISPIATLMPAQAGADKTSSNLAAGSSVLDTRSINSMPSYYRSLGSGVRHEFKTSSVIGSPSTSTLVSLETRVPWYDTTGGVIVQEVNATDGVFVRKGSSDDTGWGAWYKSYDNQNKPGLDNDVLDGTTYARIKSAGLIAGGVNYAASTHTGLLPYTNHASVITGAINASGAVQNLGGTAAASITPIASLMPAQAGADVTGSHTSANTSAVGTNSASDVNNTVLSGGGINFASALHTNKSLDNIGDGTTYLRMPSANMDSNRRGLVDFGQAHLNKTMDNVPDGATRFGAAEASADKTANHVYYLVQNVNGGAALTATPKSVSGFGQTFVVASPNDKFLISGSVQFQSAAYTGLAQIQVQMYIDGVTTNQSPIFINSGAYFDIPNSGNYYTVPYYAYLYGMSAPTTHSLTMYVSFNGTLMPATTIIGGQIFVQHIT
jgi:hypothetical protein